MLKTGIFVFIFAIFAIHKAQSECDPAVCSKVCNRLGYPNSSCAENSCNSLSGKKCADIIEETCDYVCDKVKLDGECDEKGYCVCSAKLKSCLPCKCDAQCLEDPRGKECIAQGGVVTADECLKYGWIRTCSCVCDVPIKNGQISSVYNNLLNTFIPNAAKKSPE